MAVRLVIFDCDGVLFDSARANVAFYNEVLQRVGEPALDERGAAACYALSSAQLFERYYGDRPQFLAQIREVARAVDYGPFFELMEPRGGLRETLTGLGSQYKIAMATNRGKTAQQVLTHFDLDGFFDLAVGVNDVERPKPAPDMLLHCAGLLGVASREAVYVGDQPSDAASAGAADMGFIGMGPAVAESRLIIRELDELDALLATL